MAKRTYNVQAPDGSMLSFEGPDNATPDQIRAAAERAYAIRGEPTRGEQQPRGPGGFSAFAGSAPMRAVGAAVDLTDLALGRAAQEARALGQTFGQPGFGPSIRERLAEPSQPLSGRPLGGGESMSALASALGMPMPQRDPETLPEYIGQFAGETLTAAPLLLRGAQMLQTAQGTTGALARATTRGITERPVQAAAMEGGASVFGGTGRMIGEQNELGPFSQAALEMGGAMAGSLAVAASPVSLITSTLRRTGGKAIFPFTEEGAFVRASARMREVVKDPDMAARMIDDLKGTALMPSARTEEPGLMAIERAVLSQDPARAAEVSQRNADTMADLVAQIRRSGDIQNTRKFVVAKRERLVKALDARIEQAGDEAAQALTAMGADPQGQARASIVVREALESALADAKVQESMLWQAIPQDARVPVRSVVAKYNQLRGQLASAQREDMPSYVTRAMEIIGENKITKTTVRELDGLYKKLGEVATAARASGEFNKARIAEEMRDSIWQSMGLAEGGPQVREAIDTARSFSLAMNERFRRGNVGRVLGFSREGGSKIAPEKTLDVVLGPLREGLLGARALKEATDNPLVLEGVSDYMKAQFVRNAVENGRVNPQKAQTFFRTNAELLDAMPALRQQLQAARSAEDVARRVITQADAFKTALDNPSVSAAARFLNAPVDQEITRIMSSQDPARYFKQLRNMAIKDRNGEAMHGLKAGLSQWLIDKSTSPDVIDIAGRPMFNGMKLRRIMQEPRVDAALKTIYSKQELENLNKLADMTAKLQRQAIGADKLPIIDDMPSKLLMIVGRVAGARAGAQVAKGTPGGAIQTARIGSTAVTDFMRKLTGDKATQLISDAIENPDLMAALLRHQPSAPVQQRAASERAIRAYLAGPGARLIDAETRLLLNEEERGRK